MKEFSNCIVCGRNFEKINKKHKICSDYCREKNRIDLMKPMNAVRFWIFERDNFKCVYCGKSHIEDGVSLVIEHVFPRYLGGQNTFYNVMTACSQCNMEKSNHVLAEDVILKIWDRNKKLGIRYPYKFVDDIIQEFESFYPVSKINPDDYFNIIKPKSHTPT